MIQDPKKVLPDHEHGSCGEGFLFVAGLTRSLIASLQAFGVSVVPVQREVESFKQGLILSYISTHLGLMDGIQTHSFGTPGFDRVMC